jgi:hypothetical protein
MDGASTCPKCGKTSPPILIKAAAKDGSWRVSLPDAAERGGGATRARYVDHIMGKLKRPFAELVRRTKRKHRELKALGADGQLILTTINLEEVVPGGVGGDLSDGADDAEEG